MSNDEGRRLARDWVVALGAGLLASLIVFLARADLFAVLAAAVLACIGVSVMLGLPIVRKHRRSLKVKVRKWEWLRLNESIRILAAQVKIRNRTRDTIRIECYGFYSVASDETHEQFRLSGSEASAVEHVVNSEKYFPPVQGYAAIAARSSISGWYLAPVGRDPAGGTPKCVITVKDDVGNMYLVTIPAQMPHIYPE